MNTQTHKRNSRQAIQSVSVQVGRPVRCMLRMRAQAMVRECLACYSKNQRQPTNQQQLATMMIGTSQVVWECDCLQRLLTRLIAVCVVCFAEVLMRRITAGRRD